MSVTEKPSAAASLKSVPWTPSPGPWSRADALALGFWTLLVALYFWDLVTLQRALFYFDITEINLPYRDFFADELKAGRFSRWHPGLFCGFPLYSESQAGYFHPFKYLFYPWMATWKAFGLDCVLSVWLAGAATYGWLRRHVGSIGALAGGITFGLGGFMWAHFIHTSMLNALPSVPLAFWALEWAWTTRRTAGLALGAMALACQIFAGHLQDFLLTCLGLGAYAVYRAATEANTAARLRVLGLAMAMGVLAVLLSALQWIPSKELLDRSPRAGGLTWDQLTYGSWHPELLPTLFVREAYGTRAKDTDWMDGFYPYHEMNAYLGVLPLALALVGAAGARRNRWAAFWILFTVLGGLLMLGRYTLLMDHAHRIPVLGSSRIPVRFHLWVSLAVAALAAIGADRLARPGRVPIAWAWLGLALFVAACIPILYFVYQPVWTRPNAWPLAYHQDRYKWLGRELTFATTRSLALAIAGAILMFSAARAQSRRVRFAALMPVVIAAELIGAHWHDVATIDPSYWTVPPASARVIQQDPKLQRISGVGRFSAGEPGYASFQIDFPKARDTLGWSLPPVFGLRSVLGATPMIPRRWKDYFETIPNSTVQQDIAGVSYSLSGYPGVIENWTPAQKVGTAYLFKNPNVLPRARVLGQPIYAKNREEAIRSFVTLGARARDRIVVEDPNRSIDTQAPVSGTAQVTSEIPEQVEVRVTASAPAYLVLFDTFDPGWTATVDGVPTPIYPAHVNFRAVPIPAGEHSIDFKYTPAGFKQGLVLTGIAIILAILALAWRRGPWNLRDEHDTLRWPAAWPLLVTAAAILLVVLSAVQLTPSGPRLHPRWDVIHHSFTWGAGLEAMERAPIVVGR